MRKSAIWMLCGALCLLVASLALYIRSHSRPDESDTSAPSLVGKTLTTGSDDEVYTWVFSEDGKAHVSGGEAGAGVDAEYEQDGRDVRIEVKGFELKATYDGEKLEIEEGPSASYEDYTSPYGDDCVEHEGYYRCWDIHVPEGLTGSVPLVIDMHGFTSNPSRQRAFSGFDTLADSEGFIVVWPYGLFRSWNSGRTCCGQSVEDDIDDVGFIRKLVEQVSGQYDIDLNRVYVTGLSNGCSMAQRLANEASDIVAAVACMAQYLLVPSDTGYTPVSVMEIHGTKDWAADYKPDVFPGAVENFDTWKTMNNCTGSYAETWKSGKSVAWTYQNCDDGTEISLFTIDGAGHVLYPGEETDIDTPRLAWDFMKRFTK